MEKNLGIINDAFVFEDEVVQFIPIDTKTDAVIINIRNKHNDNEEENNHSYQDRNCSEEDVNKDQIYFKQVVDDEHIYENLPQDIVKNIETDDLTEEIFCKYNDVNSNQHMYDVVFNDYVSVEENFYKDFNYFRMYDYESVEINPNSKNKEYAIINVGDELDNFKAILNEKLVNTKVSYTKSYEELASADSLHHYHNILPEYDVSKTKQVPGTHNFIANSDSRHNIDVNAIYQTNEGCFEFKLDAGDAQVDHVYTDIETLALDETVAGKIMINEKTNGTAKSFNKTADEKSLISDDNSLTKHSDDSVNCNGNYDEIKYRFKGPVFRSFCEKKKKKNWKRRSLGGELKLVLKV